MRLQVIRALLLGLDHDAVAAMANVPHLFTRQDNPTREFQATLQRAGIPVLDAVGRKLWIHSFRHTYCTFLAQQIANTWQLKEILGHASISTTERYTHVEVQVIPLPALNWLPGAAVAGEAPKGPAQAQTPESPERLGVRFSLATVRPPG